MLMEGTVVMVVVVLETLAVREARNDSLLAYNVVLFLTIWGFFTGRRKGKKLGIGTLFDIQKNDCFALSNVLVAQLSPLRAFMSWVMVPHSLCNHNIKRCIWRESQG